MSTINYEQNDIHMRNKRNNKLNLIQLWVVLAALLFADGFSTNMGISMTPQIQEMNFLMLDIVASGIYTVLLVKAVQALFFAGMFWIYTKLCIESEWAYYIMFLLLGASAMVVILNVMTILTAHITYGIPLPTGWFLG